MRFGNLFGGGGGALFGDGTYSGNIVQAGVVLQPQPYFLDGTLYQDCIVITGAATVAPDEQTGAAVYSCKRLVLVGSSASLTATTNCKGLLGFVSEFAVYLNGARSHMDGKGKAGNFGDLTAYDLAPQFIRRKLARGLLAPYVAKGEGAAGAAAVVGAILNGLPGAAATTMQTGGGGSGAANGNLPATSGAGGKGGPCCGGAGGGACLCYYSAAAPPAGDYGGPGGFGFNDGYYTSHGTGGGAGDPPGLGSMSGGTGLGAGGGLHWLFCPKVSIGAGCVVSADGAGTTGGSNSYSDTGAAAGGGNVCFVTAPGGYSNNGTVRANGGVAASGLCIGGPGGVGSVNIFQAT